MCKHHYRIHTNITIEEAAVSMLASQSYLIASCNAPLRWRCRPGLTELLKVGHVHVRPQLVPVEVCMQVGRKPRGCATSQQQLQYVLWTCKAAEGVADTV